MENRELEDYLIKLERSLGLISVSEKAEIITEIKSHVLDALETSNKSLHEILQSLGEPEQVANKYLLERGLEPQRPPRHPVIKWLVIGFLGTFSIATLATFVLIWKFTPFVKVDEEKGRVQLMGGLIDVNEERGTVKIGNLIDVNEKEGTVKINGVDAKLAERKSNFSGEKELTKNIKKIGLDFSNVNLELKNSDKNSVEYKCNVSGSGEVSEKNELLKFNLKNAANAKCAFYVPRNIDILVKSQNGKFNLKEITNNLDLSGMNGKVRFSPESSSKYKFNLSVLNGKMDNFESSSDPNAYDIKISLLNGKINKK